MKHASPFVISEFTNPSWKIAFQLYARIDGKRFRKNFPTRAELANYREPTRLKALSEAAAEFVAAKEHEFEQDLLSETYLVRLRREMKRVQQRCPVATVAELTPARIAAYCEFGRQTRGMDSQPTRSTESQLTDIIGLRARTPTEGNSSTANDGPRLRNTALIANQR
jgi:hypothetical protein